MFRLLLLALSTAPSADPSADCYAVVAPLLKSSGGRLTPELRNAYLGWAEGRVMSELEATGRPAAEPLLRETHEDAVLRDAVFGSVFPPDPSILQNYGRLREGLGTAFSTKYRSLLIATAVARRAKGVAVPGGEIGRDYQPEFWEDESYHGPTTEPEKDFVRQIAAYLSGAKISALDLYNRADLRSGLKTYLVERNVAPNFIGEVDRTVGFGERLKAAMVVLGQRPAARDRKPTALVWLRALVARAEAKPASVPNGMSWPLFPLDAPWPLLMPLARPIPLGEADFMWASFQGQNGGDRFHDYGPYRYDPDIVPDSLRPSRWFWDAWPDRIVHGGMCVPLSKATCDLYTGLGKPAMWAGQPGHANLISFGRTGNVWTAAVEQSFAGGPDVTFAQWYFDEVGHGIRFRDLYLWTGAEHQLGLALGMNVGLSSVVDTRIATTIYRLLPPAEKRTLGTRLLRGVAAANPFNPEPWYLLAEDAPDVSTATEILDAVMRHDAGLLVDRPAGAFPKLGEASEQYWGTLAEFTARYALLSRPAQAAEAELRKSYQVLRAVPGLKADEIAAFLEGAPPDPSPEATRFDADLSAKGDAFGRLRLAQRYRSGEGVTANEAIAESILSLAAVGEPAAAAVLSRLLPTFMADGVTASNTFSEDQSARHLIDGAGLTGLAHDDQKDARTMWHTAIRPAPSEPAKGFRAAPAWLRFDFARPRRFDAVLVWNHNQPNLTNRGFHHVRLYGSPDGTAWISLNGPGAVEIPRAAGAGATLPARIRNVAADRAYKSVLLVAEDNYGGDVYGLSAVRFAAPRLPTAVPVQSVEASATFEAMQSPTHLIDGSGMTGACHDAEGAAKTMWHTPENPAPTPPAPGLPAVPAWVRFDFDRPRSIREVLVWNHNQEGLTNRGFRKTHLYGTTDGEHWFALATAEIPQAAGVPDAEPFTVPCAEMRALRGVILAAEDNYGGNVYGLSAVRFAAR